MRAAGHGTEQNDSVGEIGAPQRQPEAAESFSGYARYRRQ
jgi:hypothetical protein